MTVPSEIVITVLVRDVFTEALTAIRCICAKVTTVCNHKQINKLTTLVFAVVVVVVTIYINMWNVYVCLTCYLIRK